MRSIKFRIIWESMLRHVVTRGAVRGCPNVAILNFKHCYVACALSQCICSCHYFTSFSIAMYAILSLFFYFQFAVAMLTNIGFVRLSPFQILHVTASTMSPVGIYPNRASYNTLMKLPDYFMVDYMYVAHSKFNASNTPKEKITLRQVKGMRWPRPITSFTHQSARCGMLVELAWDCPSPLNV